MLGSVWLGKWPYNRPQLTNHQKGTQLYVRESWVYQNLYSRAREHTSYAGGSSPYKGSIRTGELISEGRSVMTADLSKYDHLPTNRVLRAGLETLGRLCEPRDSEEQNQLFWSRHNMVVEWMLAQPVIAHMEDSEVSIPHERGVESGWFSTQVLDSVLLEGLVRRMCEKLGIRVLSMRVLGDDLEVVLALPQEPRRLRSALMSLGVVNKAKGGGWCFKNFA
eukprot:Skav227038  [mRNA]  locus=scaffold72:316358:317020:+ [translate_table: standard]